MPHSQILSGKSMIEELPSEGPDIESAAHSVSPHVLLVLDQFPKALGGGERAVLKLAENLPKYGFRASILTFFVHPDCTDLVRLPCPIYVLPLKRTYGLKAIRAAYALRQFLRTQRVRLVQTFFESSDLWAGFVVKAMSDARLVWSRRDMGILRGRKHAVAYRLMARMPDAVFAVSERVRLHCIEVDRINPERVETIYNGLDLAHYRDSEISSVKAGQRVVTTVGNIRRVKGHDLMIRAAGILAPRFPEVTFSIAGGVLDQDYFAKLESLVNDLGLAGRFQFVGAVSDLRKHLAAADIFVLPSRSEGFSNAIIEAMAAGLAVIATDVGGNAEAVEDGVSGVIVPPEDPDALAEAIAELLADPVRTRIMGSAGKAIAAKRFSVHAMMDHTTNAYRRLLSTPRRI
jgi:glycosyltransferase involved in cell wall biosynthesis